MRMRSRDLREVIVQAFAALGLVLALSVLGTVLVSSAAQGDAKGADGAAAAASGRGLGEAAPRSTEHSDAEISRTRTDPSQSGVVLGVVILVGGIFVLGWGARPRRDRHEPPHQRRVLQSVGH